MRFLKNTILLLMLMFYNQIASAQLAAGQDKFLGNIHTQGQTPLNFDLYWNQLTPGNAGKWASCEQARDDFNYWLWLDRAYDHAKQNNITFKEHTLVWGASSGEPTWMSSVPEDEQLDEVVEWFEAVAERYPEIELIDVVNEPLHDPPSYTEALGGEGETGWDWVIWSFEKAREIFPDSKLLLNEYNVLNYTSTCEDFLEIVELLLERDLIDGVGLQAHSLETISLSTIQTNMEMLAATGIDIYISEYEARGDDATQLALFQEQFTYFWEHPSVKGVTLWGYVEGDMWRETAYLLEDDGVTERPALQWLREYFDYYPEDVQYTFETNTDGNGSITLDPDGGVYDPFTDVVATAVPDSGYVFSGWTGDVGGSTNPTTLSMISNRSLTAHFVEEGYVEQYSLDVSVTGSGTVTQTPEGTVFDEGTVVSFTAIADDGYKFDGWSGASSSTSAAIEITMDGNKVLAASFSEIGGEGCDTETVISMPYSEDGEGEYCFVASGEVSYINSWNMDYLEVNGQDFTNTYSGSVPESEDGKIHIHYYSTVSWSHFEIVGTDSEADSLIYYDLTSSIDGEGSVSPSEGSYAEGSSVTLTATPASGWEFSSWSGDASGISASTTITMDSNKSITAIFVEADSDSVYYTLTVLTEGEGTVDGSFSGESYYEGTTVTLTASPASGYIFDGWSGDATGSSASLTITMDADKVITANFADTSSITSCDFGIPLAIALPSLNATYNYIHVLGSGPDLSNISNLTVNWDLTNNALWQFSVNTNDGVPNWYTNLNANTTQSFASIEPMLTISGSGFEGLDGDYYVTTDEGNFVMVETSGIFTIYCSNSSEAPECVSLKRASNVQPSLSYNALNIYPNPVSDQLTIQVKNSEIIQSIKIFNSLGKNVLSHTNLKVETSYSIKPEIPSGFYLLKIETNQAVYTKKFLKK